MSAMQELSSWLTPPKLDISPPPQIGQEAPVNNPLKLPKSAGKATIIAFLRHCGCPFAEKTFLRMREAASAHPDIHFIAVSHSNQQHTDKWLQDIGGTNPANLEIIVDDKREIYADWGLGVASVWHVLKPQSLYDIYKIAKEDGIKNRPTESGYRWQTSGHWAVDGQGKVVWGGVVGSANEIPDFEEAIKAVEAKTVAKASL
ncbi:hypothetical protein N0V93_007969 [Gnomoniopsis smithogilvyi]|uniref:Thioredoxin domain-containing protein n=1 Tax=Gnomoniopsis smithogilvyi TaxID=1191159 RepID=A0A9W9CUA8_9PEZI|nr:hypothetical protein N0V93_007969 [Gnomoniopsis smithogilvyi]